MFEAGSEYRNFKLHKDQDDIMTCSTRKQCGICNERFIESEMEILCQCDHEYCKDCLKYFVLYKIKNQFSLIQCPKQGCKKVINKESQTYKNLSQNLKQRYQKIVLNLKVLSDKNYRICPQCQDNQLNCIKEQDCLFCTKCLKRYCKTCMNPAHKLSVRCDNLVLSILKKNFMFKRCINCLFVVEKNEGCNHMTCRCGYQFCYLCGGNWNHGSHECPPPPRYVRPRSVKLIKREIPVRQALKMATVLMSFAENNPEVKSKGAKPIGIKPGRRNYGIALKPVKNSSFINQNLSFIGSNNSNVASKQN